MHMDSQLESRTTIVMTKSEVPILSARLCKAPSFVGRGEAPISLARRAGLRYQRHATRCVVEICPTPEWLCHADQWVEYGTGRGTTSWCQPDVWAIGPRSVVLFEMKAHHTGEACAQLELYARVLSYVYCLPVVRVEMTKSFDPSVVWPGPKPRLVLAEEEFLELVSEAGERSEPLVFQWRRTK